MKKQIFALATGLCFGISLYAQQGPTTNSPSGEALTGQNSEQYWSRAGNNNNNGNNNIFGTLWNSPIYTVTNGVNDIILYAVFDCNN